MNAAAVSLAAAAALFFAAPAAPSPGAEPSALASSASASAEAPASPTASLPNTDATPAAQISEPPTHRKAAFPACPPLPALIRGKPPFPAGEKLSYDLDVVGAHAARMTLGLKAARSGRDSQVLPIVLHAQTGTLFSKIRSLKANIRCDLSQRSLLPTEILEDVTVNGRRYRNEISFTEADPDGRREIGISWQAGDERSGRDVWAVSGDSLNYLSAFYFFRALQLKPGDAFCTDILVLRHLWRVEGTVVGREHASTPAGEFEAIHLTAKATRHDKPEDVREVHYWVSDDAYRLPVAAMGVIDLGTLRAVLTSVHRPDLTLEAARSAGQEW